MIETVDTLQTKIAKARAELPEVSRVSIDAVNWNQILLGMNAKFNSDQMDTLQTETELLLCGLVSTENYPKELETRMMISKTEVNVLLEDMNKFIFKKIQEEMEKRLATAVEQEDNIPRPPREIRLDPKFASIPKEVQNAVAVSGWKENLYKIAKKYNLAVDKMGELENITTKTIAGTISTSEYENKIKSLVNVDNEKFKEMIQDINEEIFVNIKNTMMTGVDLNIKEDVPLPPYKPTSNEKELSLDLSEENQHKIESDIYREHGIEIISSDVPLPKQENLIINKEVEKQVESKTDNFVKPNIISDKLLNKTVSKTVVTDYSIPKINTVLNPISSMGGGAPSKPHDPYHEAI